MVRNGKECNNDRFSSVAATFEKAITYVFAGSLIRNAEVRGSIPLCSTNNSHHSKHLATDTRLGPIPHVANVDRNNHTQRQRTVSNGNACESRC